MVQPLQSFSEIADLYRRQADAVAVLMHGFGPPWVAGSPAARDAEQDAGLAGDWGNRPVETSVMLVGPLLNHASDHLRALAAAVEADDVVLACYTLIRPIIDSTARIAYLLDPTAAVTERVRRGMNTMLLSYHDQKALSGQRTDRPHHAAAVDYATARIDAILRTGRQHGLPPTTPSSKGGWPQAPWLGARPPGEMALAERLLEDIDEGTGRLVYRHASAFVHGRAHALNFLSTRDVRRTSPGTFTAAFGTRLDTFTVLGATPVLALHRTALAVVDYAGLPRSVWQDLAQPLLEVWRASIHAAVPTALDGLGPSAALPDPA